MHGTPELVRGRALCPECVERFRAERARIGLYPPWYLWLWCLLGNGLVATVLAGIGWRRLGDHARARACWIATGLCSLVAIFAIFSGGRRTGFLLVTSAVSTMTVVKGLPKEYDEHLRFGGRRASLLLPIAVVLGVALILVLALGLLAGLFDWSLPSQH